MAAGLSADESFSAAMHVAKKKAPYFRSILVTFQPVWVDKDKLGGSEIGVTARGVLMAVPEAIIAWTTKQLAGALVHEAGHIFLNHAKRFEKRIALIGNMAGDLAINPMIDDLGMQLPYGIRPKDYGFATGLTADEYYTLLMKKGGGDPAEGKGVGAGKCGSCATGHDESDSKEAIKAAADQGAVGHDAAVMARAVKTAAHEVAKYEGKMPNGMRVAADDMIQPAVISWEDTLTSELHSAVDYRAGAYIHKYDGPSRRQAGLGYNVGSPILPRTRCPNPKVAILFDTSGSMGREDLSRAASETSAVLDTIGAQVLVIAVDCAVHSVAKVASVQEAIAQLKGGGGSDFRPAFDYLQQLDEAIDIVIAFTDGWIAVPDFNPLPAQVFWALTSQNSKSPTHWGTTLKCYTESK